MTREKFMGRLIELLSDVPEQERRDALLFFESYFEEAGPGEEEKVIEKLGSPEQVAEKIKANLEESNETYAEYSENGYQDTRESREVQLPRIRGQKITNSSIILAIIALIFISPLLKGLFGGAFGVIVTIILLPFLVVFALGVAAIGLLIGGIACVAAGIPLCFGTIGIGILTIGVGFILTSAGFASFAALIWMVLKFLPKILNYTTNLIGKIFHRKGASLK